MRLAKIVLLIASLTLPLAAQVRLTHGVLGGGGTTASGGGVQLSATAGQGVTACCQGAQQRIQSGFWAVQTLALSNVGQDEAVGVPEIFELAQNFPNPFNPVTTVSYILPVGGAVRLEIFDLCGRSMGVLVDAVQAAGRYRVEIDGSQMASGVYIYRLHAGERQGIRKMTLIK